MAERPQKPVDPKLESMKNRYRTKVPESTDKKGGSGAGAVLLIALVAMGGGGTYGAYDRVTDTERSKSGNQAVDEAQDPVDACTDFQSYSGAIRANNMTAEEVGRVAGPHFDLSNRQIAEELKKLDGLRERDKYYPNDTYPDYVVRNVEIDKITLHRNPGLIDQDIYSNLGIGLRTHFSHNPTMKRGKGGIVGPEEIVTGHYYNAPDELGKIAAQVVFWGELERCEIER